jgi:hypothetical protein
MVSYSFHHIDNAHYQYDAYRFIQKQSLIEGNLQPRPIT